MPKKGRDPTNSIPGTSAARRHGASMPDPVRRIEADRELQLEITQALEELADSLPNVADLRLARALQSVLEASWTDHVSFQEQVLFPIIDRRHNPDGIAPILKRLCAEHADLADRHSEARHHLDQLIRGELTNFDMLGYLLRDVFEFRRRHLIAEMRIESYLPHLLTPADLALVAAWSAERPAHAFPIGLARGTRH